MYKHPTKLTMSWLSARALTYHDIHYIYCSSFCFRGKQGSIASSWLTFCQGLLVVITYSFAVCLDFLGLKVDLQWALDWKSFQSSLGFEWLTIDWIDFGLPINEEKNKDFKTFFDFITFLVEQKHKRTIYFLKSVHSILTFIDLRFYEIFMICTYIHLIFFKDFN